MAARLAAVTTFWLMYSWEKIQLSILNSAFGRTNDE